MLIDFRSVQPGDIVRGCDDQYYRVKKIVFEYALCSFAHPSRWLPLWLHSLLPLRWQAPVIDAVLIMEDGSEHPASACSVEPKLDPAKVKVGDVVCDCWYRHQKIVKIDLDYSAKRSIRWVTWIPLPFFLFGWLYRVWPQEIVDASLILENGGSCSLTHCCSHPDHGWPHPSEEEIARRLAGSLLHTQD